VSPFLRYFKIPERFKKPPSTLINTTTDSHDIFINDQNVYNLNRVYFSGENGDNRKIRGHLTSKHPTKLYRITL
jgi:hypothetical protein